MSQSVATFSSTGFNPLSPVGFGCMGVTAFYGAPMPDSSAMALFADVFKNGEGYCHFDTAEVYKTGDLATDSPGDIYNETVVGKFLQTLPREKYTIATKWHARRHGGLATPSVDAASVEAAVDASLQRLGTGYIDLYYAHRMPPTLGELLTWMASMKQIVAKGKVRYIGLSEVGPQWLRAAYAVHPVACIQQEWSLVTRDLEEHLLPTCKELGVGIVAYSPLARNLLTLTAEAKAPEAPDFRATQPRYQGENFEKNKALALRAQQLARREGTEIGAILIAWLKKRARQLGVEVVPIPGTTNVGRAMSNFSGASFSLSDAAFNELIEIASQVAGPRASEQYEELSLGGQLKKQ